MIYIEKGQPVADNPDFVVIVPTGTYDEIDLLECAHKDAPQVSLCMYQAQFVKFGNRVYQQTEVLTDKQVSMLLSNSHEQIIGNRKYIDGFEKVRTRGGRIIGKNGVVKEGDLPTDAVVPNEVDTVEEFVEEEEEVRTRTHVTPTRKTPDDLPSIDISDDVLDISQSTTTSRINKTR